MRVLLASENQGKLEEFRQILGELGIEVVSPSEVGLRLDVVEDGATFAENAITKARAYAAASGLPVVADDSGLEVDALGGRPGVFSARYAGEGANDAARRRKLLAEMAGVPDGQRQARFRCAVALVWQGAVYTTEGTIEGVIIDEERGTGGFGYDPIFLVPELGRTLAELPAADKNAISHRGKAARAMAAVLAGLLADTGRGQ
ncbi:MAG: XTP/dITP diphosphatase [Anaerolineae bacterium]